MKRFTVFGRPGCGYCTQAKNVLESKKLPFRYVDIHREKIKPADLEKTIGRPVKTVPQIFHGKLHIGGYEDLTRYLRKVDGVC